MVFAVTDKKYIFTSESVGEGHPDKLCDRISDAIVDAYLNADPEARTAVECLATTGFLCIAGETRGPKSITKDIIETVARHAIRGDMLSGARRLARSFQSVPGSSSS